MSIFLRAGACIGDTYSSIDRTKCLISGAGSYTLRGETETESVLCAKGTYQNVPGKSTCIDCPEGYHQDTTGSPFCLPCSPGKTNALVRQEDCKVCDTGTYMPISKSIAPTCTDCTSGQYRPIVEGTSCTGCPAGTYSAVVGSDALINCGMFKNVLAFVFVISLRFYVP